MKDDLILERYTETVIHAETLNAKGLERMAAILTLLTGLPESGDLTVEEVRGFLREILEGVEVGDAFD